MQSAYKRGRGAGTGNHKNFTLYNYVLISVQIIMELKLYDKIINN